MIILNLSRLANFDEDRLAGQISFKEQQIELMRIEKITCELTTLLTKQ